MSDKWIKILCGKLYTGLEARFLEHAEILVHGKYIEEVGSNLPCPEGTEILDLSHLTVTPGMIDAHMHPEFFNWRDVYSDTIYNSDGYRTLATYCTANVPCTAVSQLSAQWDGSGNPMNSTSNGQSTRDISLAPAWLLPRIFSVQPEAMRT